MGTKIREGAIELVMQPAIRLQHVELGDSLLQFLGGFLRGCQSGCRARHLFLGARGRNLRLLQLDAHAIVLGLQVVELLLRVGDLCAPRAQGAEGRLDAHDLLGDARLL